MPWIKALALLLSVGLASPAFAEIYQWTDASGAVHFSDTPPKNGGHRQLDVKPAATVSMGDNIRQAENVSRSRKAVKRMLEPDSGNRYAREKQNEQEKAAQCDSLQRQLERVQAQLRAGYSNERGNRLRSQRRELSQQYSRQCVLNQ
ncbi:MAG: DUF4124 domain-containing protein [Marinobacter sp.]|nr:DUF4124 domain-containing protein [Marinobacter sp.]